MDYPGAVKDGKVLDQGEYDEQMEFAASVRAMIGRLPARPERPALEATAAGLLAAIEAKRPGAEVAAVAGDLRRRIIDLYEVRVAPRQVPDLRPAAADFTTHCAVCHGATGRGDGPAAKGLTPPPADLTDAARMGEHSLFGLYNTITLGIKGTAMTGFAPLGEAQRWRLAFYVSTLATPPAERERGARRWQDGVGRSELRDLRSLAMATPKDMPGRDGAAVLAYLRADPGALGTGRETPIDLSARLLGESLAAYRQGDAARAHQLAITSYLEGFELVEAPLSAVDGRLKSRVEAEMLRYRTLIQSRAPRDAVEAEARTILSLLDTARQRLDAARLSRVTTFTSALVILLREGLEAILVLAALVAMLIKSGRREALRYVHAGWIAALALGAVTWLTASYVVTLSGASREVTEGVTALLAAVMLLYVGFWMHRHAHAARWKAFIETQVQAALSGRTRWALASIAFLAVYREAFETVLFYQALWIEAGPAGRLAVAGGFGVAALGLVLLAWLILKMGLRLPVGWFFGVGSVLMAALAVVLAGKGIAALQQAGRLPVEPLDLPTIPSLGVYPTWQGALTQLVLVLLILAAFTYSRRRPRHAA
ncbi:MAG TPA: cytochrome c/FTR1 family iron permease [Methylomirabilota bacterium]|nr:cytochrome c/FTR1 family iron permease [Methylomirabilota bacterium]